MIENRSKILWKEEQIKQINQQWWRSEGRTLEKHLKKKPKFKIDWRRRFQIDWMKKISNWNEEQRKLWNISNEECTEEEKMDKKLMKNI